VLQSTHLTKISSSKFR